MRGEIDRTPSQQPILILTKTKESELVIIPQEALPKLTITTHQLIKSLIPQTHPKKPLTLTNTLTKITKHTNIPT